MGYSDVICPYCVIVIYWKFDYCKIGFYKVYIIAQCKILPVTMTDMKPRFLFCLIIHIIVFIQTNATEIFIASIFILIGNKII